MDGVYNYSRQKALNLEQWIRKELLKDIKNIIKFFNLMSTEVKNNVLELMNDIMNIKEDVVIEDDDWMKVIDFYVMFEDYFTRRRIWIKENCNEWFFNVYNWIDKEGPCN